MCDTTVSVQLSLKVLFTRPELLSDPSIEEASVRLSVLPIRLNIDQVLHRVHSHSTERAD